MVLWDALAMGIPDLLSNDALNMRGCLNKPVRLLLKPMRPHVQPEHAVQDTCMQ